MWQKWLKSRQIKQKAVCGKIDQKNIQKSGCDKHGHKRCQINQKAVYDQNGHKRCQIKEKAVCSKKGQKNMQ